MSNALPCTACLPPAHRIISYNLTNFSPPNAPMQLLSALGPEEQRAAVRRLASARRAISGPLLRQLVDLAAHRSDTTLLEAVLPRHGSTPEQVGRCVAPAPQTQTSYLRFETFFAILYPKSRMDQGNIS